MRRIFVACLLGSASLISAKSAMAQTAEAPPAEVPAATGDIGDIVVTAQRREQKLSNIGMSITALGGDTLTNRAVTQAADLAGLIPGLSVSDSGYSIPIYTLRGVGVNENSIGSNSSVAVYVDEVPLVFPVMTQGAILDLQRVEVLKGPQGTLYGQNSTGGAINYIANKPTDHFEAGAQASIGRFARGEIEGYVSGPLGPTLKGRIAAREEFGGDWQRSITRDDSNGRVRNFTGRGILEWEPGSNFHATLNANGWIDKSDTIVPQLVKLFPGNPALVDRNLVVLNPSTGAPVVDANGIVVTRPELIPGHNARDTDWDPGQPLKRNDKFEQTSLRAVWNLADHVSLTSLTSYAWMNRQQFAENDGTTTQLFSIFQKGNIHSFQQEVRLAADFSGVHWIVGANYGRDTSRETVFQFNAASSQVQNIFGFKADAGGIRNDQNIHNWAVFTNLDLPLTRQITLSGGIRLSKDVRTFQGCGYVYDTYSAPAYTALINFFRNAAGLGSIPQLTPGTCTGIYTSASAAALDTAGLPLYTPGPASRKLSQNNVPWNVTLNWKPGSSSLVYARVSRGFKAGNFATLSVPDLSVFKPLTQEQLTAYEIGTKFNVGRILRIEAAIFRYDYLNKQLRARVFIGPPFGNASAQDTIPKSRIKGAEISAVLRPITGVTLSASGTYLDSKILQYTGQTVDGVLQDQAGSPFNFTPKYSVNGDAQYDYPLSASLNGTVGVSIAYRSKTSAIFIPPNKPQPNLDPFRIDPYKLVDARIGIEAADGKWKAFLWGKNLFNKYYWTNVVRVTDVITRYPGMPVTYGMTASMKF